MIIFFFFNDTATTEIYTLSLHDALPICAHSQLDFPIRHVEELHSRGGALFGERDRSEEHTSELQSRSDLVCRLLLEKKKKMAWCAYDVTGSKPHHATARNQSSLGATLSA